MGETKIEWADYTFNPWIGCTKVSPGCANCYAERDWDQRYKRAKWGPNGRRSVTADSNWRRPHQLNKRAKAMGKRFRIFCASLADVFEDWPGPMHSFQGEELRHKSSWISGTRVTMNDVRDRLFDLIDETPYLDWLLLTKRPQNVTEMVDGGRFKNAMIGTSVENQEYADKRIPHLIRAASGFAGTFVSFEPLLGPVDLSEFVRPCTCQNGEHCQACLFGSIDWVIAGGESGPEARVTHPQWASSLAMQCETAGVPFLFKQWGEWLHFTQFPPGEHDLRGREVLGPPNDFYARVGKARAGRLLYGKQWDQFPMTETASEGG